MIRRGEPWGSDHDASADIVVSGDDAALAAALRGHDAPLVRFRPDEHSDLARAVGLSATSAGTTALPLDALDVDGALACNAVVLGVPPDRLRRHHRARPVRVEVDGRVIADGPATTVVVATGQFVRGLDVVPSGHPGDGRLEIQVYALPRAQRARMRRRLAGGSHLPHPGVVEARGRDVRVSAARRLAIEADGHPGAARDACRVQVVPGAYRLLV
jgi:hypothetical protein